MHDLFSADIFFTFIRKFIHHDSTTTSEVTLGESRTIIILSELMKRKSVREEKARKKCTLNWPRFQNEIIAGQNVPRRSTAG